MSINKIINKTSDTRLVQGPNKTNESLRPEILDKGFSFKKSISYKYIIRNICLGAAMYKVAREWWTRGHLVNFNLVKWQKMNMDLQVKISVKV
jgi:hypothetical protein